MTGYVVIRVKGAIISDPGATRRDIGSRSASISSSASGRVWERLEKLDCELWSYIRKKVAQYLRFVSLETYSVGAHRRRQMKVLGKFGDHRSITTDLYKGSQSESFPYTSKFCTPAQQYSAHVYVDCAAKWHAQLQV